MRTPTTEQETSPLPESWDLYKQFKGRLSVQIDILSFFCMFQTSFCPTGHHIICNSLFDTTGRVAKARLR